MIDIRPFDGLGRFGNDWLAAHYHFSFAEYFDPSRMGHGKLRVWNDDTIQPGGGFDRHGHRDMEIVTYVRKGAITHRDHLGNEGRTEAGDVQVMSAGTGILHEEHNREPEITQIFQIWIEPNVTGAAPRWQARRFPKAERDGGLVILASGRDGDDDALPIHQDAAILGATLLAGQEAVHRLAPGRQAYLVASRGRISVNGAMAKERDGVAIEDEERLTIKAIEDSEVLLADLP